MAICKFCGARMDWGNDTASGKWVKLVPIGEDVGMDRTHSDENGVLRAQHTCNGWTPSVGVTKLAAPIPASDIIGQAAVEMTKELTHKMAMRVGSSRRRAGRRRDNDSDSIPF